MCINIKEYAGKRGNNMNAWILVGEKSRLLKDIDKFINRFKEKGIYMAKITSGNISLADTGNKNTVFIDGKETHLPKLVISAYFGNIDEHNLAVSKMLEEKNTLSMNSAYCIYTCRDKFAVYNLLKNIKTVQIPKTMMFSSKTDKAFIENSFSYPLVLKINKGSKGNGVELIKSYEHLIETAELFTEKYNDDILIQEYISSSEGQDLRIILCGGKYITSFVRSNSKSFKSNLAEGGYIDFFTVPAYLIETAEKIARTLDMNIGSVDFLMGENNTFYFCEANAMPGNSYSEAAKEKGLHDHFDDVIENIINQINKA